MMKLALEFRLTTPTMKITCPQHIDEFDLNDETSVSEYDEDEQNVLYFNNLFPFNIIHPDDLKSEKDNDDNEIDIIQSSRGLEYTDTDIADFEERLEMIYSREIHRVQVVDFKRMLELMKDGLFARMVMEHHDNVGVVVFTSRAWGRLFDTRGPLVWELILEFLSTLIFGESESERMIHGKGDLHDYWRDISTDGYFLGPPASYTLIRDPELRLCHRMIAHSIASRSQSPKKGLTIIAPVLPVIDMAELVRLQICMEIDDTWAWVAQGPERHQVTAVDAPEAAEDAPAVDEGVQTNLAHGCQELTWTYGEIDDRSGEILHMDDFMYGTADGG
ncbi:hypothetical protein Tco_0844552 [Tanacetum coccineum]